VVRGRSARLPDPERQLTINPVRSDHPYRWARLKRLIKATVRLFLFDVIGGLPYPKLERSFKLFAEKVRPVWQKDPACQH
jgi:hypothetical protein